MSTIKRNETVVAFTQGASFSADEIKDVRNINRTFCFINSDDPESYLDPVTVRANTIEDALEAIGVGSSYEAEWGDFRGLIEAYENGSLQCSERVTTFTPIELPVRA